MGCNTQQAVGTTPFTIDGIGSGTADNFYLVQKCIWNFGTDLLEFYFVV
jgi:hypothetical protein